MKSPKTYRFIFFLFVFAFVFPACSKGLQSPVEPSQNALPDITSYLDAQQTNGRSIIAIYDAVIDPVAQTFSITPSEDRSGAFHFPLTTLYSGALKIVNYGFTPPEFWAEIQLNHPLPGSGRTVYDPRVIAILPANPGVSFNYPILNVVANDSVIFAPDGYTKLFDSLGGSIAGNANPFMAYFKSQPNREWSSTGMTSDTKLWELNLGGFGGPFVFKLVVDISTNYPNPSQPQIDNAPEPVDIDCSYVFSTLTSSGGGYASVTVWLKDWQGGIGGVVVEAPALFTGLIPLGDHQPGPPDWSYLGFFYNTNFAPAGVYNFLVGTWDTATGIYMYKEGVVTVAEG
jgi:hypothetical protein